MQRGARSQGQSLPGPSLCYSVSPISEPVAALASPQGLPVCRVRRLRPRPGGRSRQGQARLELPRTKERSRLSVTALGVCCLVQKTRREEGC